MKYINTIISVLSLIGVLVLFTMVSKKNKATGAEAGSITNTSLPANSKIAYVDLDSLDLKYTFAKTKRDEFKKRQSEMENEIQGDVQKMQNDYNEVQKKAQAKTLTEPEYEAAQKRLGQMQQSLQTRKQTLSDQLMQQEDEFIKEMKNRLDHFLADYNKDKHFDYIFSYSSSVSGTILYANSALNITEDVVNGLNAAEKGSDDKKKNK